MPKEAGFNVEKHIKSPLTGLLIIFFIAEKPVMGFSLTEMLGRYLRKNGVQNARFFFQCFYIQTVKSKQNSKCSFYKHFTATMKTKELHNNYFK